MNTATTMPILVPNVTDPSSLNSITLYYRAGTSDKVYKADIVPAGNDLFTVNFAYGRRGSMLQTGTKTSTPVPYAKARAVFEQLVREKTGKGYTPGEDGTPYQQTPAEPRNTGIACQLLNPIDEAGLDLYLINPRYCMQEKFDGRRLLVRKLGQEITGINRNGLETGLPQPIAQAVSALPFDCILDGEAVGDTLHVFDLLLVGACDLHAQPYSRRLSDLAHLLLSQKHPGLQLVHTAESSAEKLELFRRLKAANREGVVFKDMLAPYAPGRPASGGPQVKFKFYETASCIVTGQNLKRSVSLGLFHDGNIVPCGNVTIPPDQLVPVAGELVEVRYLYAFPESRVLYQPVYLGRREDISEHDCILDQLKYKAAA